MLRKLVLKLFIILLPAILLSSFNFCSAILFAERVSDNMVNGKISFRHDNYNDRRVAKRVVEKEKHVPETIILGGSTSMGLSSDITGYSNQRNLWVSGGSFEDWIAILGLYKKQNELPKRLIIAPDPIDFFKGTRDVGLGKIGGFIFNDAFAYFYGAKGYNAKSIGNLFSPLLEILKGLLNENCQFHTLFSGKYAYRCYNSKEECRHPEQLSTQHPDGHTEFAQGFKLWRTVAERNYMSDFFDYFVEQRVKYFTDIREFCETNGIEMIVYLPPKPPAYIDDRDEPTAKIKVSDCEELVRNLSAGLVVRGTFYPEPFGFTNEDFHDQTHIKLENRNNLKQVWDYIR